MWRLQQELVDSGDTEALLAAVSGQFNEPKAILAKVQEWYDEPEQETFEVFQLADGRVFEFLSTPQRLDDRIVGRVLSFHDVTERRRAEAAERASEQRFCETLESVSLIAIGIDAQGVLTSRTTSSSSSPAGSGMRSSAATGSSASTTILR
ncbi:MAG: hypothetical protein H0U07_10865 [Actinobacteria bacterium]|nr:hypothetical protein [Actinomycetota bacterium]